MTGAGADFLAQQFEQNRARLHGVAYRLLGSGTEADDAVQEAWLRLSRADAPGIENLSAWLTTVVSRICLDQLRGRAGRRETALEGAPERETQGRAPRPRAGSGAGRRRRACVDGRARPPCAR
ncbi:MAG: sigma factor [Terriglobales bacterium]